jgi:protein-S-isoprenylcysteine O-methyltransferase Ste14
MKRQRFAANLLVTLQFLSLALLIFNPFDPWLELDSRITYLFLMPSIFILIAAAISLRPALTASPIPKSGAPLIERGIYRYVRHPMYSALTLLAIVMSWNRFNLYSLTVTIFLTITLVVKAKFEDSLLLEAHPDARNYQQRTGAFFPRIFK